VYRIVASRSCYRCVYLLPTSRTHALVRSPPTRSTVGGGITPAAVATGSGESGNVSQAGYISGRIITTDETENVFVYLGKRPTTGHYQTRPQKPRRSSKSLNSGSGISSRRLSSSST
jgi:hypothetical protein